MEQNVPVMALQARRWVMGLSLVATSVWLAGCSSTPLGPSRAPVVDRSGVKAASEPVTAATPAAVATGQENAGKPGYYTVRSGDTLIRIGLDTGQNWRDIAAWNGISNPNLIEVGQVIRVVPPVPGAAAAATPVSANGVVTSPVGGSAESRVQGRPLTSSTAAAPVPAPTPAAATPAASEDIAFAWPVNGVILERFDESRNKGVDLSGRAGDAVLAAADGRVVYAGSGLRGYGNLIILKHNNTYLTAYAHNQTLLVKEDQNVRQGQKIAEMGNSDADKVKLHFEVRRQGKPVDPLKYLPAR